MSDLDFLESKRLNAWRAMQAWAPTAFGNPASLAFVDQYESLISVVNRIPTPSTAIDVSDDCWLDIPRPDDQSLAVWMERYEVIERLVRLDAEVRDCTVWIDGSKVRVALIGDGYSVDDLARIEGRLIPIIYYVACL